MSASPAVTPCQPTASSALTSLGLAVAVIAFIQQTPALPSFTGEPAANKPYRDFDSFYPFYLSEHAHPTNRLLHFIGTSIIVAILWKYPLSILSVLLAGSLGVILNHACQGLDNGLAEAIVVFGVFFTNNTYLLKQCKAVTMSLLLIGYGFAWVGHFFFEKNKPASFIYPTYSLMGDFTMFFEIFTGKIGGVF